MDFFGDQRSDLTIMKKNFPENTLIYTKQQGVVTNLKAGQLAIYLDYVALAQILPASVCPPNINDDYVFPDNEVPLLVPLYNTENGYFKSLRKWLGYIIFVETQTNSFIVMATMKRNLKFFVQI